MNCPMCGSANEKLKTHWVKTDKGTDLKIPMCDQCITKRQENTNEQSK